jgi:hypothetical protein
MNPCRFSRSPTKLCIISTKRFWWSLESTLQIWTKVMCPECTEMIGSRMLSSSQPGFVFWLNYLETRIIRLGHWHVRFYRTPRTVRILIRGRLHTTYASLPSCSQTSSGYSHGDRHRGAIAGIPPSTFDERLPLRHGLFASTRLQILGRCLE